MSDVDGFPTLPVPRFKVGDTVYWARYVDVRKPSTCPDCKDTRKWKLATPAGDEFSVDCQRCCSFNKVATFEVRTFVPDVQSFSIRSIEAGTHNSGWGDKAAPSVKYMSGAGGGNVIHESKAYATEGEAMNEAVRMAAAAEAEYLAGENGVRERERRAISTYRMKEAIAQDALNEARDWRWKHEKAVEAIKELPDSSVDLSESNLVAVARHLLEEIDEDEPEEWEARFG